MTSAKKEHACVRYPGVTHKGTSGPSLSLYCDLRAVCEVPQDEKDLGSKDAALKRAAQLTFNCNMKNL
jgi:hypothetical protein